MVVSQDSAEKPVRERTVVLGLVADSGVCAALAGRVADELPDALGRQVSEQVRWEISVSHEAIPLDENGEIPLADHAHDIMSREGWDLLICLTDLPRLAGTTPVVGDVIATHDAGLISLPTMGWIPLRRNVRKTIASLVQEMTSEAVKADHGEAATYPEVQDVPSTWLSPVRRVPAAREGLHTRLVATGVRGRLRLLAGMVRANRPWRLVGGLATAIATAVAGASFGIFFSNVWTLADALPELRLLLINVLAMGAMIGWLIVYNELWTRPSSRPARRQAPLYNVSTVITLSLGVLCMYAVLYSVTLIGAVAVISADYLQSILGHPVGLGDYASIVWLASSMGTVAGALGSGLESRAAVRRVTFSQREQERQDRRREKERKAESGRQQ